jgi:hypothetical protein
MTRETSRRIGAALESVDGRVEGPSGELDRVGSWKETVDLLPQIDFFLAE